MEASSPLAAMQPPAAMFAHCGFKPFGPNSFNFKDLSMKRSQPDYFTLNPMRGSSPTASLAADLSQNFYIDQSRSPQLPTPSRRLFGNDVLGGLGRRDKLTTPPLPSSSPGPSSDSMDISPLPHKLPYRSNVEIHLQSPTPELIPADISDPSTFSPSLAAPKEPTKFILPQERRKPVPLRPNLSRVKGLPASNLPPNPAADNRLPPFKFGNGMCKPPTSSSMTLSEIFSASPSQERAAPMPNNFMGAPRARQPLAGQTSNVRNGSPIGAHVRKNSNPMIRPRKQFRRSLSMFEHPEDFMKQEGPCAGTTSLPSILDIEPPYAPQLPHFTPVDSSCELPRITKETIVEVLDGKYNQLYEKLVIVDCRFEYEYDGGHIEGAVNFNDKEELTSRLFDIEPTHKALLIFHCEYSAHRAPIMAKHVRNKDRAVNAEKYPYLTYPELYILDGGYSSFFEDYRPRCIPQNYVEMDAKEHAVACERGLGKVKQRSKLLRAQTYAFGEHSPSMDSSPTAAFCGSAGSAMDMDFSYYGKDVNLPKPPTFDSSRLHGRRMLSY